MKLDFLSNIKERISSPLLFSFLISWIVYNWRVTIALLWYDPSPGVSEHLSLIKFIENETVCWKSVGVPIIFALLYTILSPIIKNLTSAFKTWNSKWGEQWNLDILKASNVSMDKYLTLRRASLDKEKELDQIIKDESLTQEKLKEISKALEVERKEKAKIQTEMGELKSVIGNLNRASILDGKWTRKITTSSGTSEENWEINQSSVFVMIENNSLEQRFIIQDFVFDQTNKKLYFVLWDFKKNTFYAFNDLQFSNDLLTGFEYALSNRNAIRYARQSNDFSGSKKG